VKNTFRSKLIGLLLLICLGSNAQLSNSKVIFGRPASIVDFTQSPPSWTFTNLYIGIYTLCNVNDSQGNLQFITNGTSVFNKGYRYMENGDTITRSTLATAQFDGLGVHQFFTAFQSPKLDSTYYIFYLDLDTGICRDNRVCMLKYAKVDMRFNNDSGKVVIKDRVLWIDSFSSGRMTAVKHANGKDWWIVVPKYFSNQYFKFLVQTDTILGPIIQSIGPVMTGTFDQGGAKFSNDGNLYATCIDELTQFKPPLVIMNFDRCSGEFYNVRIVDGNDSLHTTRSYGFAFSPNNRFLYSASRVWLWQYDLTQQDLKGTRIAIAERYVKSCDYFTGAFLAHNNKIYIGGTGGGRPYNVINYPDSLGMACGWDSCSFQSPDHIMGNSQTPNNPNYDLGPVTIEGVSAGADTLVCAGDTVRIGSTARAEVLYEWLPQAGLLQNNEAEVSVSPLQSTSYILHATDTVAAYSCFEKYDTVTVSIIAPGTMGCPTGIKEQQAFKLRVFPNPAREQLVIETAEHGKYTLNLRSISGQKLLSEEVLIQNSYRLPLQGIAAGSYVLEVENGRGEAVKVKVSLY
jgi:hypothetical protein